MGELDTLPAPVIPQAPTDKWASEKKAFQRLLPSLLKSHMGQYVAIHNGQVVESGADKLEVGGRAYARFGYIPIFVSLVSDQPLAPVRFPSPRTPSAE